MFEAAEASFEQLSSVSHRAAAWIAQGDLAVRRGDDTRCRASLPPRGGGASGLPVLGKEVTDSEGTFVQVLVLLALTAALDHRDARSVGFFDGH